MFFVASRGPDRLEAAGISNGRLIAVPPPIDCIHDVGSRLRFFQAQDDRN